MKLFGRKSTLASREAIAAYVFLSPWLIGLLCFLLIPILLSLALSLTRWDTYTPVKWVGLANYQEMFTEDRLFLKSLGVTLKFMVVWEPLHIILGVLLGLLLNQKLRGMNFFRTLFYAPAVISGIAVALMWMSLLDPDFGVVNYILERWLGIQNAPHWLKSPIWAMPSLWVMYTWGVGGSAVIYLAGLQNISPHLYEAAEIDGAGSWRKFWNVTLPLLSPTIFFMLITGLIGGFQTFTQAYVVGGSGSSLGGPDRSLLFYMLHLYQQAFIQGRMGYGAALAWFLVVIAVIVVFVVFGTSERWVYYEAEKKA